MANPQYWFKFVYSLEPSFCLPFARTIVMLAVWRSHRDNFLYLVSGLVHINIALEIPEESRSLQLNWRYMNKTLCACLQ